MDQIGHVDAPSPRVITDSKANGEWALACSELEVVTEFSDPVADKGENKMLTLRKLARLSVLAMAGLLTVSAPVAAQTLKPDDVASLLENADTSADHLTLAGHYAAEAEQLKKGASRHDKMAVRYRRLPPKVGPNRRGMARHCKKLATSLRSAAKAADELAAAHREMAEESPFFRRSPY